MNKSHVPVPSPVKERANLNSALVLSPCWTVVNEDLQITF